MKIRNVHEITKYVEICPIDNFLSNHIPVSGQRMKMWIHFVSNAHSTQNMITNYLHGMKIILNTSRRMNLRMEQTNTSNCRIID